MHDGNVQAGTTVKLDIEVGYMAHLKGPRLPSLDSKLGGPHVSHTAMGGVDNVQQPSHAVGPTISSVDINDGLSRLIAPELDARARTHTLFPGIPALRRQWRVEKNANGHFQYVDPLG